MFEGPALYVISKGIVEPFGTQNNLTKKFKPHTRFVVRQNTQCPWWLHIRNGHDWLGRIKQGWRNVVHSTLFPFVLTLIEMSR